MPKSSESEIKAATEAATQARTKAKDAQKKAYEAGGNDEALNAEALKLVREADVLESKAQALSQNPLKNENDRAQGKKKTELERAQHSLKSTADRIRELGGDPSEIVSGTPAAIEEDDQAPVTRGELKEALKTNAKKSAIELAEEIDDEDERQFVVSQIESGHINVPGDPKETVRLARLAANSMKSTRIVEEIGRKRTPREHGSGGGGPVRQDPQDPEFTADEKRFMQPPYNVSKQQIIDARQGKAPLPNAS